MGSRVVKFGVGAEGGGTVLVEVDDPRQVGAAPASRDVAKETRETFEAALSQVMPAVNAVTAKFRELAEKPDEIAVEFGIKFTAEANALIAKTAVEGNLKVTLKWQPG